MAHGENAEKRGHTSKEYWKSRLSKGGETPGGYTKQRTHRAERRASKTVDRSVISGGCREE